MSHLALRTRASAIFVAAVVSVGVAAAPAAAQNQSQTGLVNVGLNNTDVQVPIGIAANVCGVTANVIAQSNFLGNTTCRSAVRPTADNPGGGQGGNQRQRGLVNVGLNNTTVQLPIGVAANVCGVAVNALAAGNVAGSTVCNSVSAPVATT